MIGLVAKKKKRKFIFKILADSVFWKEKKRIMFSERKRIWLFFYSKGKKRKFIFKILADSVFWKEKKKDHFFLKGKEFGCFFFFLKEKKRKFIFKILADSVF